MALPKSKIFPKLTLLGLIYGIAYLTYNSAYFSGKMAAQIAAIFQVSSVITVLLAIILLKEKSKLLLKLLAATVGFIITSRKPRFLKAGMNAKVITVFRGGGGRVS